MYFLRVDSFPDYHYIRFENCDDPSHKLAKQSLGFGFNSSICIGKQNYIQFLLNVRTLFGEQITIFETCFTDTLEECLYFDPPAYTSSHTIKEVLERQGSYLNQQPTLANDQISTEAVNNEKAAIPVVDSSENISIIDSKNTDLNLIIKKNSVTISEFDNDYIIVKFCYNPDIITILKTIVGRKYLKDHKLWIVPKIYKHRLISILKNKGFIIQ